MEAHTRRIEPFRSTKEIILMGPNGERIVITKFHPREGKNLGGHVGIDLPPGWHLFSARREVPTP